MNLFYELSELIGSLAEIRGSRKKWELKVRNPEGIKGRMGEVYMTRIKRVGRIFTNPREKGFIDFATAMTMTSDIDSVIYHCKLDPHEDFILSLEEHQVRAYVGKRIVIKEFRCARHPFHWFIIKNSSSEVYPEKIEILEEAKI